MDISELLNRTLLLDLETARTGRIRHVGAVLNDRIFERTQKAGSKAVLEALDDLVKDADFVLGHNLLGHDFPVLKAVSPELEILKKPVIDTLYLSSLAFPQNPYTDWSKTTNWFAPPSTTRLRTQSWPLRSLRSSGNVLLHSEMKRRH